LIELIQTLGVTKIPSELGEKIEDMVIAFNNVGFWATEKCRSRFNLPLFK
jgi:hypothetical protein